MYQPCCLLSSQSWLRVCEINTSYHPLFRHWNSGSNSEQSLPLSNRRFSSYFSNKTLTKLQFLQRQAAACWRHRWETAKKGTSLFGVIHDHLSHLAVYFNWPRPVSVLYGGYLDVIYWYWLQESCCLSGPIKSFGVFINSYWIKVLNSS